MVRSYDYVYTGFNQGTHSVSLYNDQGTNWGVHYDGPNLVSADKFSDFWIIVQNGKLTFVSVAVITTYY